MKNSGKPLLTTSDLQSDCICVMNYSLGFNEKHEACHERRQDRATPGEKAELMVNT